MSGEVQVLTDTYGRILTQHDPDGDVRTAVVWVPGDSRMDWDDASDQELVTLLGKYGYNDALTIENNNVTINDNGETETLIWDSAAMDFTVDVDMFVNGSQNMFFRTVNDGNREVTVLCDAAGKALTAPQVGEYTGVLFNVTNNGTLIDTITEDGTYSRAGIIEACGGSFNITALEAGASVFLLVMGTHVQFCNADDAATTPNVTEFPALSKRLSSEDGKYYACSPEGKLILVDFTSGQIVMYCDANNQWLTRMDDYSSIENEFGGSVVIEASNVGLDGFDVVYNGVTYKYKRQNSSLSPEPEIYQ